MNFSKDTYERLVINLSYILSNFQLHRILFKVVESCLEWCLQCLGKNQMRWCDYQTANNSPYILLEAFLYTASVLVPSFTPQCHSWHSSLTSSGHMIISTELGMPGFSPSLGRTLLRMRHSPGDLTPLSTFSSR